MIFLTSRFCLTPPKQTYDHRMPACRYRMPNTQQFAYFFAFIGAGLVFMILAFSVFLPVIVLAPSKFALSFTIGSLLVMAGFAALRGLKQQASHMLSASRLPFTAGKVNHGIRTNAINTSVQCWKELSSCVDVGKSISIMLMLDRAFLTCLHLLHISTYSGQVLIQAIGQCLLHVMSQGLCMHCTK